MARAIKPLPYVGDVPPEVAQRAAFDREWRREYNTAARSLGLRQIHDGHVLMARADCRLQNYLFESWRNAFCWSTQHDVCPWGLPRAKTFGQRHPYLVECGVIMLAMLPLVVGVFGQFLWGALGIVVSMLASAVFVLCLVNRRIR